MGSWNHIGYGAESHSGLGNGRGIYGLIFLSFWWYLRLKIEVNNWCILEDLLFQKLESHLQFSRSWKDCSYKDWLTSLKIGMLKVLQCNFEKVSWNTVWDKWFSSNSSCDVDVQKKALLWICKIICVVFKCVDNVGFHFFANCCEKLEGTFENKRVCFFCINYTETIFHSNLL